MSSPGKLPWLRRWPADLAPWIAFLFAVRIVVQANVWIMRPTPLILHNYDEAYLGAFALRMLDGKMLPYVDAVSHRGPMLYWMAATAAKIFDPMTWMPIRVCGLLTLLSTVIFTFLCGWRADRALAGAIGALSVVAVLFVDMWPLDGIAFNGEHVLNMFMMPALFCVVAALGRLRDEPRPLLLFVAGMLAALGALGKQVGAASILPLGLWAVVAALSRPTLARRQRWILVLAFGAGVALPIAVVVVRYAVAGELRTLVYWMVTYNVKVYMAPFTPQLRRDAIRDWLARHIVLLGVSAAIAVAMFFSPLLDKSRPRGVARAYDEHGFGATVGLGTLAVIAASNSSLRDFGHYYVQIVPWAGLLLGLAVERVAGTAAYPRGLRALIVRTAILAPLVAVVALGWSLRWTTYKRDRASGRGWPDKHLDRICKYISAHSTKDDHLFVWGFAPDLYVGCQRRPASRFVLTTFVAGFVPWFGDATPQQEESRAVPGSRAALLHDLEETKPPVLIDAPESMGKRSIHGYAELEAYLSVHYCGGGKVDEMEVFLRRTDAGECIPPSKPVVVKVPSKPAPKP